MGYRMLYDIELELADLDRVLAEEIPGHISYSEACGGDYASDRASNLMEGGYIIFNNRVVKRSRRARAPKQYPPKLDYSGKPPGRKMPAHIVSDTA